MADFCRYFADIGKINECLKKTVPNANAFGTVFLNISCRDEVRARSENVLDNDVADLYGSGQLDRVKQLHCLKDKLLGNGLVGLYGKAGVESAAYLDGGGDGALGRDDLVFAVFLALGSLIRILPLSRVPKPMPQAIRSPADTRTQLQTYQLK